MEEEIDTALADAFLWPLKDGSVKTRSNVARPFGYSWRIAITILCFLSCTGCYASTTYSHVTSDEDSTATGIRYYDTSPYLLVYSDSKGGLQWRILYLPDQTKKMSVKPTVFLGRSEVTLQFHNGSLAGTVETIDTTEIPKAVIAAAQVAAGLAARFFAPPPGGTSQAPHVTPYLFKITVKGDTVTFSPTNVNDGAASVPVVVTLKEKQQ